MKVKLPSYRLFSSACMETCTRWDKIMPARPKSSLSPALTAACAMTTPWGQTTVPKSSGCRRQQSCRLTRVGGGIWNVPTCSTERESCLQTAGHLWHLVSSTPSLVSATPYWVAGIPPLLKLLHALSCLALTLLPTAFQLITPCEQPVNHPCTHISLGLGEREFIPLAQLSETSSCQK